MVSSLGAQHSHTDSCSPDFLELSPACLACVGVIARSKIQTLMTPAWRPARTECFSELLSPFRDLLHQQRLSDLGTGASALPAQSVAPMLVVLGP